MKKFISFILFFITISTAFAQYKAPKNLITTNIGLGLSPISFPKLDLSYNRSFSTIQWGVVSFSPAYFGIHASYDSKISDYYTPENLDKIEVYNQSMAFIGLRYLLNISFMNDKIEIYPGLSAGAAIYNNKIKNKIVADRAMLVFLGTNYYINDDWAINAELSYTSYMYNTSISAGISYRF